MAIRIKPLEAPYKAKVTYWTASADGVKREEQSYIAHFRRVPVEEVKEMQEDAKRGIGDANLLLRVLVGWEASEIGSNEQIPFTETIVRQVSETTPGFAGCSVLRFFETVGASREKN